MFQGHGGEDGQVGDLFEGLKDGKSRRKVVEHMLALTQFENEFFTHAQLITTKK